MNTYDDLVNDYLRAVEQALAGVPAHRRAELLADLSEQLAAKRAELAPGKETEIEVRSILELLGDPEEVAAEALYDAEPTAAPAPAPPIVIEPKKRSAALIWVLVTIGAVATMCVLAGLAAFVLFASSSSSSGDSSVDPAPITSPSLAPTASPS
ncbi:HAAS signaling domain-containing protein [Dactylosporangium sp. CA-233914]|uniref:HAAS signaling domain-containing protein n=1 Tax=Dactylosporangium sp. CA-233914 TaxID=3239934 RepID=UPI003D8CC628